MELSVGIVWKAVPAVYMVVCMNSSSSILLVEFRSDPRIVASSIGILLAT